MKIRLWYFLILMGFAFAACEKDADFRGGPPDHAGKGRDVAILDNNNGCEKYVIDGIAQTDLMAGQNINVGTVKVEFDNGFTGIYGHAELGSCPYEIGAQVNSGDIIGTMGNTGSSTGTHVHFILKDTLGQHVNPLLYMPKK